MAALSRMILSLCLIHIGRLILIDTSVATAKSISQSTRTDSRDNLANCDCYIVSGKDPGYFQYYRFWDFRAVPNDGNNNHTSAPQLDTSLEKQDDQNVTSRFFNTTQFNNDWSIQSQAGRLHSPVPAVNSAQNVFISRDVYPGSTFLALRASRLPEFVSMAEIESNERNVLHGSIRARMRMVPAYSNSSTHVFMSNGTAADTIDGLNVTHPLPAGAVLGFFLYQSDTEESDIEILTSDSNSQVRYSNQPDWDYKKDISIPGASTNTTLPGHKVWTDWHDHRIDWFDHASRWYIDGEHVLDKTVNVPKKPSGLVFNLWSDGGTWSGNMSVGAQVVAGFEWIEMAYNVSEKLVKSSKRRTDVCKIGCNIDTVRATGSVINGGTTLRESGIMLRLLAVT